jgi:hypothetical protein
MAALTNWGWSLSNPINPEFATPRGRNAAAGSAIAVALLLHVVLGWLLLQQSVFAVRAPAPMDVELVRLPPPALPAKPVVVTPKPVPKTVIHISPVPVTHVKIRSAARHVAPHMAPPAPKIRHFNQANADSGLGLDLSTPDAGNGQGSLGNFEDSVKERIAAAKTYPPGIKGIWNECVENYRVTVAGNGALVSYKLYGCGNPFLDAAARAAILVAAPYPVPPNFGGTQYDVYGSLIFKKQQ